MFLLDLVKAVMLLLCVIAKATALVLFVMVLVFVGLMAAPTIVEKATEDKPIYPHSGFSPECPTWQEEYEIPKRHSHD